MLNLQFFYLSIFFLPILLFIYNFFILCFNYFMHIKNFLYFNIKKKKKKKFMENTNIDVFNSLLFLLYINFIFFNLKYSNIISFTYKNFYFYKLAFFIVFILTFFINLINFLFKYYYNSNYTLNYNSYIGINFLIIIFYNLFTTNFLIFFFFVELLSYLFYFQFLQIFNKIKTKKISNFYLDNLLLYYWLNFFASITMLYSIILLFDKFNTINFFELNFFINQKSYAYIFFFLGFSAKIGIPGFHFFKIEIYKNLKLDSIINFSFYSMFGYIILLKQLAYFTLFYLTFIHFIFLFFLLFFLLIFSQNLFKINNILLFFGYSTIINTVLIFFIIF